MHIGDIIFHLFLIWTDIDAAQSINFASAETALPYSCGHCMHH